MDEAPVPARAIVVLGGGEDYRPFAAARLWKQGLAPVILVPKVEASPTESLGLRPTTTQVILGVLKAQGIPDSAIQLYGQDVSSTREEALAVQTWLQSNAVDEAPAEFPPNPQVPPPAPPPDSPSGTKPQEPKTENREPGTKNVPPAVILIPTDPFATRRTNAFFEKTLPGYDVRVLRIDPPDLKVDSWWTQEKGLITFQNEVIKWLFYKVKY